MVSLHKAIGGPLLGTYLNSCLFLIELCQVIYYFRHMNNDSWIMKTVAASVVFIDAVGTVATCISVYLYAVTHWGDFSYLQIQNWPIVVHFIATGIVGTMVQGFMLYRFWRMTQHSITVFLLGMFSMTAFTGSIGTAVETGLHTYFSQRGRASRYVTLWLIAGTAADIGIAASLVWRLHRVKTQLQPTKSLIRRLMTSAISTGTSTSIIAIIAVFAYLHEPSSNVPIGVTFILGRVYSCTMFYLLNNRSKLRGEMADGTVEVGLSHTFAMGGIFISRTAVVTRDHRSLSNTGGAASISPVLAAADKNLPFSGLVSVHEPEGDSRSSLESKSSYTNDSSSGSRSTSNGSSADTEVLP